jgi:hypothetical protein
MNSHQIRPDFCPTYDDNDLPRRQKVRNSTVEGKLGLAKPEMAWLQKLLTRRSFNRTGLPSGVVSTAATNDVWRRQACVRLPAVCCN